MSPDVLLEITTIQQRLFACCETFKEAKGGFTDYVHTICLRAVSDIGGFLVVLVI